MRAGVVSRNHHKTFVEAVDNNFQLVVNPELAKLLQSGSLSLGPARMT
jgi:hypothetical protein